jgi:hypothetical protein
MSVSVFPSDHISTRGGTVWDSAKRLILTSSTGTTHSIVVCAIESEGTVAACDLLFSGGTPTIKCKIKFPNSNLF